MNRFMCIVRYRCEAVKKEVGAFIRYIRVFYKEDP